MASQGGVVIILQIIVLRQRVIPLNRGILPQRLTVPLNPEPRHGLLHLAFLEPQFPALSVAPLAVEERDDVGLVVERGCGGGGQGQLCGGQGL